MQIPTLLKSSINESLNSRGYAIMPKMLSSAECETIIALYDDNELYRKTIDMKRYRFGAGEYKYYAYPLPDKVQELREALYPVLANLANEWVTKLNIETTFPEAHKDFITFCHSKNQSRPTPLILKYEIGGFNTLHQDLFGDVFFPFQAIIMLTQRDRDYEGGELVLTEQIPRAQSKAEVIHANQGDIVIVTTNFRPIKGVNRYYRTKVKHGVSEVKSGTRYTLGIIFHDAA